MKKSTVRLELALVGAIAKSGARLPHSKKSAPTTSERSGLFQMVFKLRLDLRRFRPRRFAADFPDLEPYEAPDRNVFAQLGDRLFNHLADCHALVLDVVLFVEAIFLVELLHLPVDDLLDDRLRFARRQRLRLVDIAFFFEHLRRHFFAPHVPRIERRDMHRDVMRKLLVRFRARHEIRLAIQLYEHADFPAGVDVAAHQALAGFALRLLCRGRLALLAQDADGFLNVAARFHERRAAVTEARVGPLAQFFHELCWDLHSWLLCTHLFLFALLDSLG